MTPAAAVPESAPAQAVPADAWRKMLGIVSSQRPAIHNALLAVKIVAEGDCALRLFLANKFEASMIEKALPELEGILARTAGRQIKLFAELAAARPASAEAHSVSPQPDYAPAPGSEDVPLSDEEEAELNDAPSPQEAAAQASPRAKAGEMHTVDSATEPELKHLAKVFHGRITRINKIK